MKPICKFKQALSVLMALCLLLALSGCGASATTSAPAETEGSTVQTTPENTEITSSPSEEPEDTAAPFWQSAREKIGSDDLYIFQAHSFSENAAWIIIAQDKSSGVVENSMLCLIDTEGNMLYSSPVQGTEYKDYVTTNFSSGVSLVSTDEDQYIISNKGEVVWSILDNGVSEGERLFGKDSVESIVLDNSNRSGYYSYSDDIVYGVNVFNGWTLVDMYVNNFDGTGDYYGILNPDGTWLLEPQKKMIYMDPYTHYAYWQNNDDSFHGDTYVCMNLETKETTDCGYIKGNVFPTDPDDCETVIGWENARHLKEQDGLIYDADKNAFIDESGAPVIDCSKYTFYASFTPKFHNGYSVLAILNPDGVPYITVIDKSGNQVFAPIKFQADSNTENFMYGYVDEERFVMTAAKQPDFYEMEMSCQGDEGGEYIDLTGKKMTDIYSEYRMFYPYSCGLALVEGNNADYHYLDTDGNDAFPTE